MTQNEKIKENAFCVRVKVSHHSNLEAFSIGILKIKVFATFPLGSVSVIHVFGNF